MNVHPSVSEQAVAGQVIFVTVGVHDSIDVDWRPAICHHGDRWVDQDRLSAPANKHRVSARVRTPFSPKQNTHRIGELQLVLSPVNNLRGHAESLPQGRNPERDRAT